MLNIAEGRHSPALSANPAQQPATSFGCGTTAATPSVDPQASVISAAVAEHDWKVVVIHVGMHKTATTYIQQRLRANAQKLARASYYYPPLRSQHLELVDALRKRNPSPWHAYLSEAESKQSSLLLSAEIFSIELGKCLTTLAGDVCAGRWLKRLLHERGWRLELISFVRDQPSYLNSRYTQLVKRFHTTSSFKKYVRRVLRGGTESECDMMRLYTWIFAEADIPTTFLPFAAQMPLNSNDPDPLSQFLACLPVPLNSNFAAAQISTLHPITHHLSSILASLSSFHHGGIWTQSWRNIRGAFRWLASDSMPNQQPGRLGVLLSRRLAHELKHHHPDLWAREDCREAARQQIQRWSRQKHWYKQPYYGLTVDLWRTIRNYYAASNAAFVTQAWGHQYSWDGIFGSEPIHLPPVSEFSREDEIEIEPLLQQLLTILQSSNHS